MSDAVESDLLVGTWLQLHEEGGGDVTIFVRQGADLPPSRGRITLTLGADGTASVGTPGPDDRPRDAAGGWELDEDILTIDAPVLAGEFLVVTVSAERMVLRRRE